MLPGFVRNEFKFPLDRLTAINFSLSEWRRTFGGWPSGRIADSLAQWETDQRLYMVMMPLDVDHSMLHFEWEPRECWFANEEDAASSHTTKLVFDPCMQLRMEFTLIVAMRDGHARWFVRFACQKFSDECELEHDIQIYVCGAQSHAELIQRNFMFNAFVKICDRWTHRLPHESDMALYLDARAYILRAFRVRMWRFEEFTIIDSMRNDTFETIRMRGETDGLTDTE